MKKPIVIIYHIPKTGGVSIISYCQSHLQEDHSFYHSSRESRRRLELLGLPAIESRSPEDLLNLQLIIGHDLSYETRNYFPNRECRFSTTLREPISRITSNLNYCLSMLVQGHDDYLKKNFPWVKDKERFVQQLSAGEKADEFSLELYINHLMTDQFWPNFQCSWLIRKFSGMIDDHNNRDSFQLAQAILEKFWLVGTTDKLTEYANSLGRVLQIPDFDFHANRSQKYYTIEEVNEYLVDFDLSHDKELFNRFKT